MFGFVPFHPFSNGATGRVIREGNAVRGDFVLPYPLMNQGKLKGQRRNSMSWTGLSLSFFSKANKTLEGRENSITK